MSRTDLIGSERRDRRRRRRAGRPRSSPARGAGRRHQPARRDDPARLACLRLPAAAGCVGMAGVLDTARFQALAALTGVAPGRPDHGVGAGQPRRRRWSSRSPRPTSTAGPLPTLHAGDWTPSSPATRGSGAEVVGLLQDGQRVPGTRRVGRPDGAGHGAGLRRGHAGRRARRRQLRHPRRLRRPARPARAAAGCARSCELDLRPDELAALRAAADRIRERRVRGGSCGR